MEGAHEAIIDPAVFDMVQAERKARKRGKGAYSGKGKFGIRIKCGECGAWYGAKTWHSTSKYRRTVYQCNQKWEGDKKCGTPHLTEETIKREYLKAVNKLLGNREEIFANLREIRAELFDGISLEAERTALQSELAVVKLDNFIRELAKQPDLITEWDERLWVTLIDHATAYTHTDLRFTFKDGTQI